jgi:ligand-binding sensor domain-containing protein
VTIVAYRENSMALSTRGWRAGIVLLALALYSVSSTLWAAGTSAETPRMRRLGAAEGMPSRMVLALAQDRQGYIWAATDDGLARVDGVGLRVWRNEPDDPGSLPGNEIETLLIDPLDRVWVGSNGVGLSMLGPGRERFERFPDLSERCEGQFWSLAYAGKAQVHHRLPVRQTPNLRVPPQIPNQYHLVHTACHDSLSTSSLLNG